MGGLGGGLVVHGGGALISINSPEFVLSVILSGTDPCSREFHNSAHLLLSVRYRVAECSACTAHQYVANNNGATIPYFVSRMYVLN